MINYFKYLSMYAELAAYGGLTHADHGGDATLCTTLLAFQINVVPLFTG